MKTKAWVESKEYGEKEVSAVKKYSAGPAELIDLPAIAKLYDELNMDLELARGEEEQAANVQDYPGLKEVVEAYSSGSLFAAKKGFEVVGACILEDAALQNLGSRLDCQDEEIDRLLKERCGSKEMLDYPLKG